MTNIVPKERECPQEVSLAAYLDGELDAGETARVEEHARACKFCAGEIREQRRLLATLDAAFAGEPKPVLPDDFARAVAARARTDMSGVRARGEGKRAFAVCGALAVLIFASLGAASFKLALDPFAVLAKVTLSVVGMFVKAMGDLGAGAAVLLRFVGGRFVSGAPHASSLLWLSVVAVAIVLLRRMIGAYHREEVSE